VIKLEKVKYNAPNYVSPVRITNFVATTSLHSCCRWMTLQLFMFDHPAETKTMLNCGPIWMFYQYDSVVTLVVYLIYRRAVIIT